MSVEPQKYPVMCITQDGLELSHLEQVEELCRVGARWIQLRMKGASPHLLIDTACAAVAICREHGAICIVNDRVDIAIAAEADGVHIGKTDGNWREARHRIGPDRILGGTVNSQDDALRATRAGCLDYVGIGPWRFTATKQNLSPVLGPVGVRSLVAMLDGMPAWAIGGIEPVDAPNVRATGAAGVAVSSGLFRNGNIEANFKAYVAAWAFDAT